MTDKEQNLTTYGSGQILCKEGEKTHDLFFVREGSCEIIVQDREAGTDAVVAEMSAGSVIGIMSFLEEEPRSATVRAKTEVKTIVVKATQRDKLLDSIPKWFKALLKQMAADLRRVDKQFLELNEEYKKLEKRYNVLKNQVKQSTEQS